MNESNQRKNGAILSYLSIIVNTLIQLLYTPLLIRTLGQSEYGLYSLINSVVGYLTVLDLGFGNAIVVYTAKYRATGAIKEEQKLHGMFKIIFYIIAFIAGILGLMLFLNTENFFKNTMSDLEIYKSKVMMIILTFNLVMTFIFNIYSSIITAYERFVFQKILSIIGALLKPLIMVPLLFLGFKSISMAVVLTIVNTIICISNYIYCIKKLNIKIKYNGFDKNLFKVIFNYSIWIFIGIIVDKINWSIDQFVLGAVSGTIAVSIYSIASTLNQLFINLSTAISGVLLPKMSKLITNKADSTDLTKEFIKVGRLQYYVMLLMGSGLALFGKQFILFWAGEGFAESYYVSLVLIIPLLFPLIQNLGLSIMQAMNKYKFRSIVLATMSVFNIIISIFLSKEYGAIGAAIGTSVSLIICNIIIMNIYYYRVIKLNIFEFWKNIFKISIVAIVPILLILLIMGVIKLTSIYGIAIYILVYTTIYCIFMYIFSLNNYEKGIIKKIIKFNN